MWGPEANEKTIWVPVCTVTLLGEKRSCWSPPTVIKTVAGLKFEADELLEAVGSLKGAVSVADAWRLAEIKLVSGGPDDLLLLFSSFAVDSGEEVAVGGLLADEAV